MVKTRTLLSITIVLTVFSTFILFQNTSESGSIKPKEYEIKGIDHIDLVSSKKYCVRERFSDVCYLRNVGIDKNGAIVLFDHNSNSSNQSKIGNTITARHDFKKAPNVMIRSLKQYMNESECLSVSTIPSVYYEPVSGNHYWHAIHDSVMPFFATLVENMNLIETKSSLEEPEEITFGFSTKELKNNQMILHSNFEKFSNNYEYLIKPLTDRKVQFLPDLLEELKRSNKQYLCFKNLAVGVSDKANLYFRDQFVKHDRRPFINRFLDIIYQFHNMTEIKPLEWKDTSKPLSVNIISRKRSRKFLNEKEVLDRCNELGKRIHIQCNLVSLEKLSKMDQMKFALTTSILIGVHGNGLSNILWMNKGAAVIQVWPFACKGNVTWQGTPWYKGENFIIAAQKIPGNYFEWESPLENSSLRDQPDRPEVKDPDGFWKKNFFRAQKLFLSQSVEMDLDVLDKLITYAYNAVKASTIN